MSKRRTLHRWSFGDLRTDVHCKRKACGVKMSTQGLDTNFDKPCPAAPDEPQRVYRSAVEMLEPRCPRCLSLFPRPKDEPNGGMGFGDLPDEDAVTLALRIVVSMECDECGHITHHVRFYRHQVFDDMSETNRIR